MCSVGNFEKYLRGVLQHGRVDIYHQTRCSTQSLAKHPRITALELGAAMGLTELITQKKRITNKLGR